MSKPSVNIFRICSAGHANSLEAEHALLQPLQQLRQLLTPPEQIHQYLITLIPAALSLHPQDDPNHTLALFQAAAAAAPTCGLQESCSRQALLLLQELLGPNVSLSPSMPILPAGPNAWAGLHARPAICEVEASNMLQDVSIRTQVGPRRWFLTNRALLLPISYLQVGCEQRQVISVDATSSPCSAAVPCAVPAWKPAKGLGKPLLPNRR